VEVHRGDAGARDVTILTETTAAYATIDPEIIGRILDNLISNAIRHTPARGQVIVSATALNGGTRFSVADTGCGVAPEMCDRLFEPFVTGRADGTGLGLAIARELAEAHGGRLTLLNAGGETQGRGAVFVLDLTEAVVCQLS
jgi:signal transduction histidine kinase